MKKIARRQFAMNTLYSISAIGVGLGVYDGRLWPFILVAWLYWIGYRIVRKVDDESC